MSLLVRYFINANKVKFYYLYLKNLRLQVQDFKGEGKRRRRGRASLDISNCFLLKQLDPGILHHTSLCFVFIESNSHFWVSYCIPELKCFKHHYALFRAHIISIILAGFLVSVEYHLQFNFQLSCHKLLFLL